MLKRKIAMATMALIPLTATSAFAGSKQGIVTATSLNVRSGPSTNNSVLFSVKKNEKVDILDSMSGWYKISTSKGKTGWASSEYINTNIDSNSDTNENKKVVTANSLNMRSGASTSYRVITKLSKGTVVEVISESNGWSKIKNNGRLGYVSSEYLTSIEDNTTTKPEQKPETTPVQTTTKVVNTTSLNVRSGPSTSYSILGKLKKNEKVEVISESNGWSKIKFEGKEAYTSSQYLSSSEVTETIKPETTPVQTTTKVVNTTSLNVRSGPSTSYSILGKLKKNEKVEVISESNGWSKIKFEGKEAYTSSQYLSNYEENTTPGNNNTITGGDRTEIVKGATVNYKALTYTLSEHIERQLSKGSGNQVDSTIQRVMESSVSTFAFVNANRADVEYFINPANFTNSSKGMLQFLRLDSYKGGVTADELNSYLNSLSPSSTGSNVFYNQGQSFIDAAKKYNIDLVYLVAHSMVETGYGKSTLAKGQTITKFEGKPLAEPVTVYNFFGIGAFDGTANLSGAEAAYKNGWTTVEATIEGSAKWIADKYIHSGYKQNTLYKMRWSYEYYKHQYATDVNWANIISGVMYKLIDKYDTASNLTFEVPVHKN